jgi:ribosomal protein S18 acetylase RimI-like enzyme
MREPRFFTLDYVEQLVLRNGTRVRLRLLRPDDKATLRAGFERLSPASRYTRFLGPKTTLSDDELRYLCDIDQENHFAIGAMLDDDLADSTPVGLGIGRFIRLADQPNTAEAAIAVADEVQHQGLGKLMFLRLSAAAAERGIERLRCEVLASNASMTALLAQIAPDRTVEIGSGMMSIEIPIEKVEPTQGPASAPRQSALYRLLRAAAANAVEWTDGVRRLWRH